VSATPRDPDRFAERAQAFAALHAGARVDRFVRNLSARIETLETGAGLLPATVHDAEPESAWVCSPRTTYVDCAGEESERYLPRWAAHALRPVLAGTGTLVARAGLDRAVSVNNWLLSTNLYPVVESVDVPALLRQAVDRWPDHAIWFRSLNEVDDAGWLAALERAGCRLVASRQVYLYEDLDAAVARHRDLRRDLKGLVRTALTPCGDADITDADYARIAELYTLLYLGKYSRFSPAYTAEFMRAWHVAGLLEFEGFRGGDGQLLTVLGLFRHAGIATAPIVGYDTALPPKLGLYRLATACAYRACRRRGWRLNFSAGASEFKRFRGGVPAIEYSAVMAAHLPRARRAAIGLLAQATRRIGVPLLRRYRL